MDNQGSRSAETFAERRKSERYSLKLRVSYTTQAALENQTLMTQSISRDLGLGGIAIVVNEKLETGQTLRIQIELPAIEDMFKDERESMSALAKTVTLVSRVIWSRKLDAGRFILGIQFLDLEQIDATVLKSFLEEYKLYDSNLNEEAVN